MTGATLTKISKKELIDFLEGLDIQVKTSTKARGHQGFFFKNRIDVSRHLHEERAVEVLVHEFAHYIHSKIDTDIYKSGGSLEKIFDLEDIEQIKKELLLVTSIVDKNSRHTTLKRLKNQVNLEIKELQEFIQLDYPNFMRSKKFKEFDRYIRFSKAKYLLKYDRVTLLSPFLKKKTILSVDSVTSDFTDMPKSFAAYIKLKSLQRKQARVSRRINKLNKYYSRPSELFARLVEGLFVDMEKIFEIAPASCERFFDLLNDGYYLEMRDFFELTRIV